MADENESIEDEVVIETESEDDTSSVDSSDERSAAPEPDGDELDSYSKGVQNRIKKLTERYRQEERDKAEAVRLSQQLMEENKRLKSRVQSLDSGYLTEYKNRLATQEASARLAYKQAVESGDPDAMLAAQEALSNLAIEKSNLQNVEKTSQQQRVIRKKTPEPARQAPAAQAAPAAPPKPDPKAQSWAERNEWFGQDRIMTTAAFAIHQQLVEDEGFDPQSDEYYNEIDGRLRREFPHKFEKAKKSGGASQVASAGNSASRSTKQGRRSVKLTHSQVAIAKKLGVPLEEYAKYVKE